MVRVYTEDNIDVRLRRAGDTFGRYLFAASFMFIGLVFLIKSYFMFFKIIGLVFLAVGIGIIIVTRKINKHRKKKFRH